MKRLEQYDAFSIPASSIFYDESFNCRGEFTLQSVSDLAGSISDRGLQFPVVVQPAADVAEMPAGFDWRMIAGHRRFFAVTKLLKWLEIPASIRHGLTERDARILNFTENLERHDLNPVEEAFWIKHTFPEGITLRQAAKELKRDTRWVAKRLLILESPTEIQELIRARRITLLQLEEIISKRPTLEEQIRVAQALARVPHHRGKKARISLDGEPLVRTFRRRRNKAEINDKVARFIDSHNPVVKFAARFGAWCAGHISDEEFEADIAAQYL
jgi:ParB family chromosome partitioning protein